MSSASDLTSPRPESLRTEKIDPTPPFTSRFEEPSSGSRKTMYLPDSTFSGRWAGRSISSVTIVGTSWP